MEVMTQPQNAERVEQGQVVAGFLVHCQEPPHTVQDLTVHVKVHPCR